MDFSPKAYKKELDYSYALGAFPTVELLKNRPASAIKIFFSPRLTENGNTFYIRELCARAAIPCETNEKVFRLLSPKENCFVISAFRKPADRLDPAKKHIVLVNPGDMGNAGTIIRAAAGFGFGSVGIISPGADIYHPRAVRASMGAVFGTAAEYFGAFELYAEANAGRDFYTFMTDGAVFLDELAREPSARRPYSLIFGNESSGLPEAFKQVGVCVKIRQTERVDSLNLPVAAGIAMHAFAAADFAAARVKA